MRTISDIYIMIYNIDSDAFTYHEVSMASFKGMTHEPVDSGRLIFYGEQTTVFYFSAH